MGSFIINRLASLLKVTSIALWAKDLRLRAASVLCKWLQRWVNRLGNPLQTRRLSRALGVRLHVTDRGLVGGPCGTGLTLRVCLGVGCCRFLAVLGLPGVVSAGGGTPRWRMDWVRRSTGAVQLMDVRRRRVYKRWPLR